MITIKKKALLIVVAFFSLVFAVPATAQLVIGVKRPRASVPPLQRLSVINATPYACHLYAFGDRATELRGNEKLPGILNPGDRARFVHGEKNEKGKSKDEKKNFNPFYIGHGYGQYAGTANVAVPVAALCYDDNGQYAGYSVAEHWVPNQLWPDMDAWTITSITPPVGKISGPPVPRGAPEDRTFAMPFDRVSRNQQGEFFFQIVNNSSVGYTIYTESSHLAVPPNGGVEFDRLKVVAISCGNVKSLQIIKQDLSQTQTQPNVFGDCGAIVGQTLVLP